MLTVPLLLSLYACNADNTKQNEENTPEAPSTTVEDTKTENRSLAKNAVWEVDERLQEPTKDSTCYMCNMKVYMKDTDMGMFAAQAVREDGSVVFYDDIGCLLNDEYVNEVENEKFVRDYVTLNWFNVDEAIVVKTDLKSPMNWGYIFFKYQEDADAYIQEHKTATITPLNQVREEGIERHKKMKENSNSSHSHSSENNSNSSMDMGKDNSSEESHE